MSTFDRVVDVLKAVSETDEVQLIVAFSQEFGIDISPAEFERERWATPRMIVADIESKMSA
jgi:acyl carrier protein